MGVDFYPCEMCGEVFCDVGGYYHCAGCEVMLCEPCGDQMIEKYGTPTDQKKIDYFGDHVPNECDLCSGAIIRDSDIVNYILYVTDQTREELEEKVRKFKNVK